MILKGSSRGSAKELSAHLMNMADNDHVELYELRGFLAEDLANALQEAECVAKGSRCTKHLFSLSLSPPENATDQAYEDAVDRVEKELGLEDHPRAIVFHEKEGRRHAHAVWSRIDHETMTATPLPFFKNKLMGISRDLYLENEWDLPKGILDRESRNPLNFTFQEWQQAKRTNQDPRLTKAVFQDCWKGSDSPQAFRAALEEHGYYLARGDDRRGFVAVDLRGEVYSVPRMVGVKTKEVKERLGNPNDLPSVNETKTLLSERIGEKPAGRKKPTTGQTDCPTVSAAYGAA